LKNQIQLKDIGNNKQTKQRRSYRIDYWLQYLSVFRPAPSARSAVDYIDLLCFTSQRSGVKTLRRIL